MTQLFRYTKDEIEALVKTIVVLIDTREQKNIHITDYLDKIKVPYKEMALDHGDYSFYIPKNEAYGITRDLYFTDIVTVERKGCLEELSGNFCNGRARIEEEFTRKKGRMYLMVEDATYEDIVRHNYDTQYNPVSFIATIDTFEARYNIQTSFISKVAAGYFIYHKFKYHLREYLKGSLKC